MAAPRKAEWRNLRLSGEGGFLAILDGAPLGLEPASFGNPEKFFRSALEKSFQMAGPAARLRIQIDSSLSDIPWESFSYFDADVVVSPRLSLARLSRGSVDMRPPSSALHMLLASANAGERSLEFLDREIAAIRAALASAPTQFIKVTEQNYCTPEALRDLLSRHQFDIFHFVGHGESSFAGPALLLEGGRVMADDLSLWLRDAGVRLAVFGGCETKKTAEIAADGGVPAAIGFCSLISDVAAKSFAQHLYASLAKREPLEDAMLEARLAIQGFADAVHQPVLIIAPDLPFSWTVLAPDGDDPVRRHNLTQDPRLFIGRAEERAELRRRLTELSDRLVTVTAMGGMGKTRLSRQVTLELSESFPDGAFFVECDGLGSRGEILAEAAAALGLEERDAESLRAYLAERNLLLTFDCFERLVSQADVLEDLLQEAPGLRILVTSRIVLGLPREQEYKLPQMPTRGKRGQNADSLTLFEDIARRTDASFRLTGRNLDLARKICEFLEGVPLAIVLAAGQLRYISIAELWERVQNNALKTLRAARDPKGRHGSLTTVVTDSWNLIEEEDRRTLMALGVFGGAFTMDDAEAVVDHPYILEAVGRLIENSLIERQPPLNGQTRYKLLDSVRDFLTLLADDPAFDDLVMKARDSLIKLIVQKIKESDRLSDEGRNREAKDILANNLSNLRMALRYAIEGGHKEAIAAYAFAPLIFFHDTNMQADFYTVSEAAGNVADETNNLVLKARVLGLTGAQESRMGNVDVCIDLWTQRLRIMEQLGNVRGQADALIDLSWQVLESYHDTAKALQFAGQALARSRTLKDDHTAPSAVIVLARLSHEAGDERRVKRRLKRTLVRMNKTTFSHEVLFLLQNIFVLARAMQDIDLMMQTLQRLIVSSQEVHRPITLGWSFVKLAEELEKRGHFEDAFLSMLTAYKIYSEVDPGRLKPTRVGLARLKERLGEQSETLLTKWKSTPWKSLVAEVSDVTRWGAVEASSHTF